MDVQRVLDEMTDAISRYKKASLADAQDADVDEGFYEETIKSYQRKIDRCIDAKNHYRQKLFQKYPRFAAIFDQADVLRRQQDLEAELKLRRRSGSLSRLAGHAVDTPRRRIVSSGSIFRGSERDSSEFGGAAATATVIPELKADIRQIKHRLGLMTANLIDLRNRLNGDEPFKRASSANSSLRSRTSVADYSEPRLAMAVISRRPSDSQSKQPLRVKSVEISGQPSIKDIPSKHSVSDGSSAEATGKKTCSPQRLAPLDFTGAERRAEGRQVHERYEVKTSATEQKKTEITEMPKVPKPVTEKRRPLMNFLDQDSQSDVSSSTSDEWHEPKLGTASKQTTDGQTGAVETKPIEGTNQPENPQTKQTVATNEDGEEIPASVKREDRNLMSSESSDDDSASKVVQRFTTIAGAASKATATPAVAKEVESGPDDFLAQLFPEKFSIKNQGPGKTAGTKSSDDSDSEFFN